MNKPDETDQFHTTPDEGAAHTPHADEAKNATQSQWDGVANDFKRLGDSIAEAFQSAWNNQSTQKQMTDLKEGLQSMSEQVGQVVEEARQNITSDELKTEVRRAADDVKDFGTKVVSESKPLLLDVLKTLDDGIQSLISRMEARHAEQEASPSAGTKPEPPASSEAEPGSQETDPE